MPVRCAEHMYTLDSAVHVLPRGWEPHGMEICATRIAEEIVHAPARCADFGVRSVHPVRTVYSGRTLCKQHLQKKWRLAQVAPQ